jgi:hypothetical protein
MILKINPADVVSIPTDYNGAKGRCCKYEVVGQVNGDPKAAFASIVNKEHSKPVAPVKTAAAWPFETGNDVVHHDEDEPSEDDGQLYDLMRVHGDWVEYYDMTLEEARAKVQKNLDQKKAKLKIVKAGTDEEVQ